MARAINVVPPGTGIPKPASPSTTPPTQSSGGASAQVGSNDWKNLFIRGAEFLVGLVLVVVGLQAIVGRSKIVRETREVVIGAAGTAAKAAPK